MSDRCNAPTGKKCIAEGMADWRGVLFRPRFDAAENQFNRPAQTAREVASAQLLCNPYRRCHSKSRDQPFRSSVPRISCDF